MDKINEKNGKMKATENSSSTVNTKKLIDFSEDIFRLCAIPSVSGFEYRAESELREIYGDRFDSITCDGVGNYIFFKSSKKIGAPRVMLDAHFDEIGFVVSEVLEGGFLRLANIGGIDRAILQSARVSVYGKERLCGVIISTPPHLRGDSEELADFERLLVDVGCGYSKSALESIAPVGTPVGFYKQYGTLGEKNLVGVSFDNKACGAILLRAVADTDASLLACDVYVTLSCREEVSGRGGAYLCANAIKPDYAMVVDVNLANAPDVPARESVKLSCGISISLSTSTDRELTRAAIGLCEKNNIALSQKAEPTSTGTNAPNVRVAALGVPVVDVGLPLRNMHTYTEIISLEDCNSLYEFTREFILSTDVSQRFRRRDITV